MKFAPSRMTPSDNTKTSSFHKEVDIQLLSMKTQIDYDEPTYNTFNYTELSDLYEEIEYQLL